MRLRTVVGIIVAMACVWLWVDHNRARAQANQSGTGLPAAGQNGGQNEGRDEREQVRPKALVIASWNLTDAAKTGALVRHTPERRVWRNTFVPRNRRSRAQTRLNETLDGADIVLLQGVNSIREVRNLFPARRWKLIVSRAILKVARGRGPYPRVMPLDFATTAVAVRYQLGLRVTGQQHLLELAGPDGSPEGAGEDLSGASGLDPTVAPASSSEPEQQPEPVFFGQAGLAVRVFRNGQVIWLLSVAFGSDCLSGDGCEARKIMDEWTEDKRDFDIPVVIAGRFYRAKSRGDRRGSTASVPEEPASGSRDTSSIEAGVASGSAQGDGQCAHQDILLDSALDGSVELDGRSGCIALATLK